MPNHFLTVGLCARDFSKDEDIDEASFDDLNGANLCQLVKPLPDDLQGITSSTPPCRYVHKTTGEIYKKDCNGPVFEKNHEWQRKELSDSEIAELEAKHGAATWYEWCNKHWGTKWGTYDTKVHELGGDGSPILIEFQSAWGPPSTNMMKKITEYLRNTYGLCSIKWLGHDPSGGTVHVL